MTLRLSLAVIALLAAPAAQAAPPQPGPDTTVTANRSQQTTRKVERTRPGTPLKPRVIEAPGAALMIIPASYDPSQIGLFNR